MRIKSSLQNDYHNWQYCSHHKPFINLKVLYSTKKQNSDEKQFTHRDKTWLKSSKLNLISEIKLSEKEFQQQLFQ